MMILLTEAKNMSQMPKVKLNGRWYYVDLDKQQIQNVNNPAEIQKIDRQILECLLKK